MEFEEYDDWETQVLDRKMPGEEPSPMSSKMITVHELLRTASESLEAIARVEADELDINACEHSVVQNESRRHHLEQEMKDLTDLETALAHFSSRFRGRMSTVSAPGSRAKGDTSFTAHRPNTFRHIWSHHIEVCWRDDGSRPVGNGFIACYMA